MSNSRETRRKDMARSLMLGLELLFKNLLNPRAQKA